MAHFDDDAADEQEDATNASVPVNTNENMEKRCAQYIVVRDLIKNLKDRQAKEMAPLLEIQEKLQGKIRVFLDANKVENLRTKAGTCYTSVKYTATVRDAEAFMNFVKEGNWDLIERRANATVVKAYVKQHNTLPAGVSLAGIQTVGVRRPGKSKA